ncbi:hypothetical protein J0H58_10160 [bacterium]|nr:hypothetical protein [bacterium]
MEIQCPTGGTNVLVQGAGSGGAGTICARGTVTTSGSGGGSTQQVVVRVRVVTGEVTPPPPDPEPVQSGDVDVSPVGQDWSASNVPVSSSGSAGVPSTLIAWERVGSGSWSAPTSVWFNAGGANPTDCCSAAAPRSAVASFAAWPPPPPPLPPAART